MHRSNVRLEILVRVLADLALLNTSLLFALLPQIIFRDLRLSSLVNLWLPAAFLISVLAPVLFYVMGFYTKGRSYSGKYKALVILQSTALLFSTVALCLYFVRLQPAFPRSSLLLAFAAGSVLLLVARLWAKLWKYLVIQENQLQRASVERDRQSVLLIGGAGYIGSALLPKLLDRGYHVRLLDCFLYGDEPIKPVMQHPNLEVHRGDFRNVDTVVAAMREMKSVIHLGGLVGDPACALDEELTIQINLIATRMIAQVAKGNRIPRFVFASSCSVYGASDQSVTRDRLSTQFLFMRVAKLLLRMCCWVYEEMVSNRSF